MPIIWECPSCHDTIEGIKEPHECGGKVFSMQVVETAPTKIPFTHTYERDGFTTGEFLWWLAEEASLDEAQLQAALPADWRYYGPPIIVADMELDTSTGEIELIRFKQPIQLDMPVEDGGHEECFCPCCNDIHKCERR